MVLAMLAYVNECDFIYKEQDSLCFGPYVDTMYSEIGSHSCIFGSSVLMGSHASPMLIKHSFIPEFVRLYLGTPAENKPDQIGEVKFARLQHEHPDQFCRYSFGVDRDRPFDVKAPVWTGQKFTRDELLQLRDAGLISFNECPNPRVFSNA